MKLLERCGVKHKDNTISGASERNWMVWHSHPAANLVDACQTVAHSTCAIKLM